MYSYQPPLQGLGRQSSAFLIFSSAIGRGTFQFVFRSNSGTSLNALKCGISGENAWTVIVCFPEETLERTNSFSHEEALVSQLPFVPASALSETTAPSNSIVSGREFSALKNAQNS